MLKRVYEQYLVSMLMLLELSGGSGQSCAYILLLGLL